MLDRERQQSRLRNYENVQVIAFPLPDGQKGYHLREVTDANKNLVGYTPNDNADLFSITINPERLPYYAQFENGDPSKPIVMEISAEDLQNITVQ